jgi:hypothetical protein
LFIVMPNVIMQSIIALSVLAPFSHYSLSGVYTMAKIAPSPGFLNAKYFFSSLNPLA